MIVEKPGKVVFYSTADGKVTVDVFSSLRSSSCLTQWLDKLQLCCFDSVSWSLLCQCVTKRELGNEKKSRLPLNGIMFLVPTFYVGMHTRTLCVQTFVTRSVKALRYHAERGNEDKPAHPSTSSGRTDFSNSTV